MFGQKNKIVIWISGNALLIGGGKFETVQTIPLPPTAVTNLEITDHDALYALIKDWAAKNPADETEIMWIFGPDVYFERVMQETEKEEWDSIVVRFLDLLPFEEVESRVYTDLKATKVVAVNKDLYSALKRGFALQGYETLAEIPAGELETGKDIRTLDMGVVAHVLKDLDSLIKRRLIPEGDTNEDQTPAENHDVPGTAPKKSSLPVLVAVFAVLLGVLGYMILTMK